MNNLDDITINDFKIQFPRFNPVFLPVWAENKVYFKDDVVFYQDLFYKCKVTSTTETPAVGEFWELYNDNKLNYTCDDDIQNAMSEAKVNFNVNLFPNFETIKLLFLYLTAYYLVVDFQNGQNPLGSTTGAVASKSVGSVSESYAVPTWATKDSVLSMYATNGYGRKYLSLIKPYLTGNILFSKGKISL